VFLSQTGLPLSGDDVSAWEWEAMLCPVAASGMLYEQAITTDINLEGRSLICLYPLDGSSRECKTLDRGTYPDVLALFAAKAGYITIQSASSSSGTYGECLLKGSNGYQWQTEPRRSLNKGLHGYAGITGHLLMVIHPDRGEGPIHVTQRGGSGAVYSEFTVNLPVLKPEYFYFDAPEWDPGFLEVDDTATRYRGTYTVIEFRPAEGDFQVLQPIDLEPVNDDHLRPTDKPE
jgi:hypothetical protein